MVNLTKPSFLTPTITVKGDVVVGKPLTVGDAPVVAKPNTYTLGAGSSTTTEVYEGKTYTIVDTINLYDYMTAAGFSITSGVKEITLVIPDNIAVVGDKTNRDAIIVDNRWPNIKVNIQNNGMILGRGEDALWTVLRSYPTSPNGRLYPPGRPGRAISSNSVANIVVTNNGIVAAGGAAGRCQLEKRIGTQYPIEHFGCSGGGGAPYGTGGLHYYGGAFGEDISPLTIGEYTPGTAYPNNRYGVQTGKDATFSVPGAEGRYNSTVGGSRGGTWGMDSAKVVGEGPLGPNVGRTAISAFNNARISIAFNSTGQLLGKSNDNSVATPGGDPVEVSIDFNSTMFLGAIGNDPTYPESASGAVYNGKTYKVFRDVNIYDVFTKLYTRNPLTGDHIIVNVGADCALVGGNTLNAGITIPANMPVGSAVTINNKGIILGRGGAGDSYVSVSGDKLAGHTSINNLSTAIVTVTNYGVIAGGGGAGAANAGLFGNPGGGGGAPYGPATGSGINGKAGGFELGGAGAAAGAGAGATWGMKGGDNTKGNLKGGPAGYIKEGDVTVTNLDSGWSRGAEGEFKVAPEIRLNNRVVTSLTQSTTAEYNGKTYRIYRAVDLAKLFQAEFSRGPTSGERAILVIPHDVAFVGERDTPDGLTIPSTWPSTSQVLVYNKGLIIGQGGYSKVKMNSNASAITETPDPGHTGINNKSSAKVIAHNGGGIAGGGGGGGVATLFAGGPGAPFGYYSATGHGNSVTPPTAATFTVGGNGARYSSSVGGGGGGWGKSGALGSPAQVNAPPGLAGWIKEEVGSVSITNYSTGWTLGREGSFTGSGEMPEPNYDGGGETGGSTINAKGHLISYGGLLGTNGYVASTGAAIQGAHGNGGEYDVLPSTQEVIISSKQSNRGNKGGGVDYWLAQPGGVGYRDYFNELVGQGGIGMAPTKAGTATAGGAGGGGAHIRGVIKNTTNQTISLQAYCGKAYREDDLSAEQRGFNGSLQLLISTIAEGGDAEVEFIYPNSERTPTDILIRTNETTELWLVGAGGGAGGADLETTKGTNGVAGGSSILTIANVVQTAAGGQPGTFSVGTKKEVINARVAAGTTTEYVWEYADGVNGNGGAVTTNPTITLPSGISISFDTKETGFTSTGKNTKGVFKGGEQKIIGTWGGYGNGGEVSQAVVGTQGTQASPGAGGGGGYLKVTIKNTSGENFTITGIAGTRGLDGVNNHNARANLAGDGIIIVRRSGIQSAAAGETKILAVPKEPEFITLAINEEIDFELVSGGGAGGTVSYFNDVTKSDPANLGGQGGNTTLRLQDETVWDGSQFRFYPVSSLTVVGGKGGTHSYGSNPGNNGQSGGPVDTSYALPTGVTLTGTFTAGHTTTRTEPNTTQQLGAVGYPLVDGKTYGSGGDGGSGNPATPGAGASGSYYKGTLKNASADAIMVRADVGIGGLVANDATQGVTRGSMGKQGAMSYKRRYTSGVDEMHLIYPEDLQQNVAIPNNSQAEIWIIGGGGAFGGNTVFATQIVGVSVLDNGKAGRDSSVIIGENTFTAKGGQGGEGAKGGIQSTKVGVVGTVTLPTIKPITGVSITVSESGSGVAVPVHLEKLANPGGYQIPGVGKFGQGGSRRWNNASVSSSGATVPVYGGGSGGSAGYIKLTVNNTSGVAQTIKATAGKQGTRDAEYYDIAEAAGTGIVVVKIKKLS